MLCFQLNCRSLGKYIDPIQLPNSWSQNPSSSLQDTTWLHGAVQSTTLRRNKSQYLNPARNLSTYIAKSILHHPSIPKKYSYSNLPRKLNPLRKISENQRQDRKEAVFVSRKVKEM